ncbi:two-component response regulator-like APRR9 isoform X3 [Vitis riparia]|uniref:two-component response regulator-like APRR9 isoform X3 n=1 Tax=Vitis riparia TaxID=96939 RepID=UPI00155A1882|nr:two-component response regulator-like APRR9 isoform X3 [Vitis riparia]
MGEAVVSSDEVMEVELQEEEKRVREMEGKEEKEKSSSGVVRWGRFLPRMVLRVLLVEPDDSTRQIIAALLRKCSYKVAAVSDGLKAWEALKGEPQNVDLILTEVELPAISGFALLSLIMEDDICKKIPVIMMSSHDSISMVLKCMLKGAADFLVKPVRKNELRNLWQHVWRRHAPTGGHVSQNLSIAQNKVEVSSENNTASNHSSDYVVSAQKKKECSEKGSDVQSSSTTPYLEAESAYMENMQGFSQLKCRSVSNLSNEEIRKHEDCIELDKEPDRLESLTGGKTITLGSEVAPGNEGYHSAAFRWEESHCRAKRVTSGDGVGPASHIENTDITGENHGCNEKWIEPSSGAIDLISTFDNYPKDRNQFSSSNDGISKDGFAPQLELSLRRFQPCSSKNHGSDERHTLNHSNSSAFSWYNNGKSLQPLFPAPAINCTELKEDASYSHEQLFNQLPENTVGTSERCGAALSVTQGNMTTLVMGQSNQAGAAFPTSQLGLIPVQGENNLEPMEELSHGSPVAGQSASSSLCNGVVSHLSSSVHGGICNRNDGNPTSNGAVVRTTAPESVNDEGLSNNDALKGMDSHHSTQREAALMKFRLKRKDRCFEKKVRYQSRKRLAEQRPRVKGQFVRQVQTDTPTADG